jgi:copper chaperone CopZ
VWRIDAFVQERERIPKVPVFKLRGMQNVFESKKHRGGSELSYYVHNIPGRLRVKIPSIKGSPNAANHVEQLLKAIEGIDSTAVNTVTGSILINYDTRVVSSEAVLGILEQKGYFEALKSLANNNYIEAAVSRAGSLVGKAVLGAMLEKAFEGSALSLLAALI